MKCIELSIRLKQRFLNDILAVQARSGHPGAVTVQAGPYMADRFEEGQVARLGRQHQPLRASYRPIIIALQRFQRQGVAVKFTVKSRFGDIRDILHGQVTILSGRESVFGRFRA